MPRRGGSPQSVGTGGMFCAWPGGDNFGASLPIWNLQLGLGKRQPALLLLLSSCLLSTKHPFWVGMMKTKLSPVQSQGGSHTCPPWLCSASLCQRAPVSSAHGPPFRHSGRGPVAQSSAAVASGLKKPQ